MTFTNNDPPTTDPPDPPAQDPPTGDPEPSQDPPQQRTLTQDEVNRIMTAERKKGRSNALKEVSARLGISIDEAAAKLEAQAKAEEAEMNDAQRLVKEAETAKAEANQAQAEAAASKRRSDIAYALVQQPSTEDQHPCRPDRVDMATDYAVMLASTLEDEDDPVATAITQLRQSTPEWFTTTNGPAPTTPTATPGAPVRKPSERKPPEQEKPQDRANQRYENMKAKLRPLSPINQQ